MRLVSEEEIPVAPPPHDFIRAANADDGAASSRPREAAERPFVDAQDISAVLRSTIAILAAVGAILSARALVFLALSAAFALAWRALDAPSVGAIFTLIVFAALVVIPLIALSAKRGGGALGG